MDLMALSARSRESFFKRREKKMEYESSACECSRPKICERTTYCTFAESYGETFIKLTTFINVLAISKR